MKLVLTRAVSSRTPRWRRPDSVLVRPFSRLLGACCLAVAALSCRAQSVVSALARALRVTRGSVVARVVCGGILASGMLFALAEPSSAAATTTWGTSIQAPLPTGTVSHVTISSVSCASAGTCTAVGTYTVVTGSSTLREGLLLTETHGTWSSVKAPLPATAASNPTLFVVAVSCAAPGTCSAVGTYRDGTTDLLGLLLTETAGTWSAARAPLPATAEKNPVVTFESALFVNNDNVSCASAGTCTAIATYTATGTIRDGVLLTETGGTWSAATAPLPTTAMKTGTRSVNLYSVSCPSAGNCTAVGDYSSTSTTALYAMLLTETGGTWSAKRAPLPADLAPTTGFVLDWVSCASAGTCTAVGSFEVVTSTSVLPQAMFLTESAGTWGAIVEVSSLPAGAAFPWSFLYSVSCGAPGTCTALGFYTYPYKTEVVTITGTTSTASLAPLPANAATPTSLFLDSVSCASAGTCTAVGAYADSAETAQALIVTKTAGTWSATEATLPATPATNPYAGLGSVSCASAGNCTAVGGYTNSATVRQGLIVSSSAPVSATPDLALTNSATPTVISGQQVTYTIQVTNTGGSAATGVTVTDTLPTHVHFDSASTTQGSCTRMSGHGHPKGGAVVCDLTPLTAGASATVTVVVTTTKPGSVTNMATVTAITVVLDTDDTASAIVTVIGT